MHFLLLVLFLEGTSHWKATGRVNHGLSRRIVAKAIEEVSWAARSISYAYLLFPVLSLLLPFNENVVNYLLRVNLCGWKQKRKIFCV
jgi:hypothetical protein